MNPFLSVWLHPKQTARYVIEHKSIMYVFMLILLGYIGSAFSAFMDSELYPDFSYVWIFLIAIILGPIFGIIMMFITSGIIFLVSKLLKGTGSFWDVFKAASLSCIPSIFAGPFYILWMFVSPESFSFADGMSAISVIFSIIMIVTSIWSVVVIVGSIAEANQFSIIRSIVALIIPAIILFIFLLVVLAIIAFVFVAIFSTM